MCDKANRFFYVGIKWQCTMSAKLGSIRLRVNCKSLILSSPWCCSKLWRHKWILKFNQRYYTLCISWRDGVSWISHIPSGFFLPQSYKENFLKSKPDSNLTLIWLLLHTVRHTKSNIIVGTSQFYTLTFLSFSCFASDYYTLLPGPLNLRCLLLLVGMTVMGTAGHPKNLSGSG